MKILVIKAKNIDCTEKFKIFNINRVSEIFVRYTNFIIIQDLSKNNFYSNFYDIKEYILKYNESYRKKIDLLVIVYDDLVE